jgi:AraC family transcriptional regulator
MAPRHLAEPSDELARIQEEAPPLVPGLFSGETRLTGRWRNHPFEAYVPGMKDHVLVAKFSGAGEASVKIDGKTLSADSAPGTITLAPRGHDGEWRVAGAVEISTIFLGPARLQVCADQIARGREPELFDRINFRDPKLFTIMMLLCDEVESGANSSRLVVERLIDLVCLQLLRAHSSIDTPLETAARRGLAAWQVRRVNSYLHDNLGRDIGLQELADIVGLSRFHFCHAFRMATGYTPHAWLTQLRIDKARQLICDRRLRIIDVALAVGFQTPSAFAARFRRITGVTPTGFRKKL